MAAESFSSKSGWKTKSFVSRNPKAAPAQHVWERPFYFQLRTLIRNQSKLFLPALRPHWLSDRPQSTDLERLIAAYKKIPFGASDAFEELALDFFRRKNLGQLLDSALEERKILRCESI